MFLGTSSTENQNSVIRILCFCFPFANRRLLTPWFMGGLCSVLRNIDVFVCTGNRIGEET